MLESYANTAHDCKEGRIEFTKFPGTYENLIRVKKSSIQESTHFSPLHIVWLSLLFFCSSSRLIHRLTL